MTVRSNPPLQVVGFVSTRRGDPERGPQVRVRPDDAERRLMHPGEVVWVQGPRRSELAPILLDDSVPRGGVILRDITGVAVSEVIRLEKTTPSRQSADHPSPRED